MYDTGSFPDSSQVIHPFFAFNNTLVLGESLGPLAIISYKKDWKQLDEYTGRQAIEDLRSTTGDFRAMGDFEVRSRKR